MDDTSMPSVPSQSLEKADQASMVSPPSPKQSRMGNGHGEKGFVRGGRGGRSRGSSGGRGEQGVRKRKGDMGRAEWSRNAVDRRARNEQVAKRRKTDGEVGNNLPAYATQFTKEEIEGQVKQPKRKVAVLIGYSGSGYKGMQLNYNEKTIEGDLFAAMVAAGAISKANADDPMKSSLVRCARTDKGVHAAGNVISLKLIIEDANIVQKINSHLSPQIRVFGISRTNSSFSAYQFCDSRIYEYLIPTHCFLPPHPESFLGKQIVALAEEVEDLEGFRERQSEVLTFWSEVDEKYIKPVLEQLDPSTRSLVLQALYSSGMESSEPEPSEANEVLKRNGQIAVNRGMDPENSPWNDKATLEQQDAPSETAVAPDSLGSEISNNASKPSDTNEPSPLENAIKSLKIAYVTARNAYRIDPTRLSRVRSALTHYIGTHNYHNYTVGKTFRDASAKRVIRTFTVSDTPIVFNNTEWLSLKVHGQSFMMHQIRKMVSMAAVVVRCGCDMERMGESFRKERISIPKAPGLGLLLERPVFDTYNEQLEKFGRDPIDFSKHQKEMEEFKQRDIYERIFREEERDHSFHSFFASIDNLRSTQMLYVSSVGIAATNRALPDDSKAADVEKGVGDLSSDDEAVDGGEG